jgi:hypothetical protein
VAFAAIIRDYPMGCLVSIEISIQCDARKIEQKTKKPKKTCEPIGSHVFLVGEGWELR